MTTEPQRAADQETPPTEPAAPTQPAPTGAAPTGAVPAGAAPQPAEPAAPPTAQAPAHEPQHTVHRTRISGLWVAIGFFGIVLLFLLIFILQNGRAVDISYLGFHGRLPLGVALLLSAVSGVLLVVLAGTARILQLRATARRHRRAHSLSR